MKKILFLAILNFFTAVLAQSQTIRYVVPGGVGAKNGSSWADASGDLQAMINSSTANDQVWVAKGTYYPDEGAGQIDNDRAACFIMKNNLAIYGGFNGDETLLSERNFNVYETILSGDIDQNDGANFFNSAGNSNHVICNNGNGVNNTAILDGFTITAGNASDYSGGVFWIGGGGMYNWEASPAIANCNFLKNQGVHGGAIFFATGGIGPVPGSPVLTNCRFSENSASDGGGIYNTGTSYPSLTNCSFTENKAAGNGGGFWNMGDYGYGEQTRFFIDCKFSKNTAGSEGGGFYAHSGYFDLIHCIFLANSAGSAGGGVKIAFEEDGTFFNKAVLTNCSFSGNSAATGGAINVTNGWASENTRTYLHNCIVWENPGGEITGQFVDGGLSSVIADHSLVKGGYNGEANLFMDPKFVDAASGNLRLQTCSPAIDAGDNTTNNLTTDLDGNTRKLNATGVLPPLIDMGAYEFQGTSESRHSFYRDLDDDDYSNGVTIVIPLCAQPEGYKLAEDLTATSGDCNDNDDTIYPTAPELCDAKDNNCNGSIDEGGSPIRLYVKWNAIGSGDGSSWTNAFNKLQDALAKASSCHRVTEIWVAEGTYYPDEGAGLTNNSRQLHFRVRNGLAVYGGFSGNETALNARNWKNYPTILSGEIQQNANIDDNAYNVVARYFVGVDGVINSSCRLDGFTITGGRSGGGSRLENVGAGIVNNYGSMVIANCIISGNITYAYGGGVYNAATCLIVNSSFFGNVAGGSPGDNFGGSAFWGGTSFMKINNCTFSGNVSINGGGACVSSGAGTISNCIFWNNTGGEIDSYFNGSFGNPTVAHSIVKGGYAGTGNLDQDPLFADAANNNFTLKPGSPAIDAGENSQYDITQYGDKDLAANPRIVSGKIDRGAYEFQSVCGHLWNLQTTNITATSAKLNWVAPINPTQWQVQYKQVKNGAKWIDIPGVQPGHRSVTIGGLQPAQNYQWQIKPICPGIKFDYSLAQKFTTLAQGVNPATVKTSTNPLVETEEKAFALLATPNPSSGVFRLQVNLPAGTSANLQIRDIYGRLLEVKQNLGGSQVITVGHTYVAGVYIAELQQGSERRVIKLVKQ